MVHPEIMCFVQGYTTLRIKPPPPPTRKKKDRFFWVLKKKSNHLRTPPRDDNDLPSLPNTPPTAHAKHRVEMVPGGRTGTDVSPCMTAQQCASAAAAAAEILISTPGSSKARQKKFHRHFKTVSPDERVLNYYSCALVADILLQGHLYITRNYFAFYSNVFGYVTKAMDDWTDNDTLASVKNVLVFSRSGEPRWVVGGSLLPSHDGQVSAINLPCGTNLKFYISQEVSRKSSQVPLLIPTSSVLKVTKEKTAYIIPNAVGITTEDEKHVFGSLLSRDSTYKLMVQVWNAAVAANPTNALPLKPEGVEDASKEDVMEGCNQLPVTVINDEESSLSGSESNLDSKFTNTSMDTSSKGAKHKLAVEVKSYHDMFSQTPSIPSSKESYTQFYNFLSSIPRPTLLLVISTFLLVVLFASAAILLFRIAKLQQGLVEETNFNGKSASEVQAFINNNLEHISKVRQSLEKLSQLIESSGPDLGRHKWYDVPPAEKYLQHNNS